MTKIGSSPELVRNCALYALDLENNSDMILNEAALARKLYLRGGVGVGAFKKIYGGQYNRGTRPSHFQTASGSVIRSVLKQLEKLNVIEKDPKGYVTHINHFWTIF